MIDYKKILVEGAISALSIGAGVTVGYYICSSELLGRGKYTNIAAIIAAYSTTATVSSTLRNCRNAIVELKNGGVEKC